MSDRRIIEVSGTDRLRFLQGLVTSDVTGLPRGPVYAALLSPQGKYLADFLMIERDEAVWLDVAEVLAEGLLRRLSMYRLRSDVALRPIDVSLARGTGEAPEGALADPRHPALGWRLYGAEPGARARLGRDPGRARHPRIGRRADPGRDLHPGGGLRAAPRRGLPQGLLRRPGGHSAHEAQGDAEEGPDAGARRGVRPRSARRSRRTAGPWARSHTQSGGRAIAHLRFDRAEGEMTAGDARVAWDRAEAVA